MSVVVSEYRTLERRILEVIREEPDEAERAAIWLDVFRFQRRWNQPYGNFCATRPEPREWREIPAVPLTAFKRAALRVIPAAEVTKTFLTSGTTGETRGAHHFLDTRLYEESVQHGWAGLDLPAHEQFILIANPDDAQQSSLSHMMGALGGQAASQRYFIDAGGRLHFDGLLDALDEAIAASRPIAMLGTALAFLHLFERLGTRRLRLVAGSYAMETGGFKGTGRDIPKSELYAMFDRSLGLAANDVINEYSMTELSSQFYARGLGRPHTGGPWVRALVIDPETGAEAADGQTGVLRIFDLANLGSVLAIETRDLAIRRGSAFELLGRDPAAVPRGCSRAADEMLSQ